MRRGRRFGTLAIAVAVAVAAAGLSAYAVYKSVRASEASAATVQACSDVRALNNLRDDSRPVATGITDTLILGDSYAQGQFLDEPREQAWSTIVADAEDWTARVDAIGGTGFTSPGPCGREDFVTRAAADDSANFDLVVAQGGLNDDPEKVHSAVERLARELGGADLIIIGPTLPPGYDAARVRAVDSALSSTSRELGVPYVSMLELEVSYGPDRKHLTAEGHEAYAAAVISAIGRIG